MEGNDEVAADLDENADYLPGFLSGGKKISDLVNTLSKNSLGKSINTAEILQQLKGAVICKILADVEDCSAGSKIRSVRSVSMEELKGLMQPAGWVGHDVAYGYLPNRRQKGEIIALAKKNWEIALEMEQKHNIPPQKPVNGKQSTHSYSLDC